MALGQVEIKKLLQKENPLVIVEIGAHIGEDTQKFLNEFENIKIYCFEPDPRCIRQFKKFIKDERCTFIECAVSNRDGKTMLNLSSGFPPSAIPWYIRFFNLSKAYLFLTKKEYDSSSSIKKSISNPSDYPWLIFNKKVEIETIRLDTWIAKNNISVIDFIWSDVQGAEKDMIEGAVHTLKITKLFYMEYGEVSSYPDAMTREETVQLLQKHNYEIVPEYSSNNKARIGNLLFKNKKFP